MLEPSFGDTVLRTTPSRKYPRKSGKKGRGTSGSNAGESLGRPTPTLAPVSRPSSPEDAVFLTRTVMELSPVSSKREVTPDKSFDSSRGMQGGAEETKTEPIGKQGAALVPLQSTIAGDRKAGNDSSSSSSSGGSDNEVDVFGEVVAKPKRRHTRRPPPVKVGDPSTTGTGHDSDDDSLEMTRFGRLRDIDAPHAKLAGSIQQSAAIPAPDGMFGIGDGYIRRSELLTDPVKPAVRFAPETVFTPSSELVTPAVAPANVKYRAPNERVMAPMSATSTVTAPDVEDTLRRVAVVIYQHILRGERVVRTTQEERPKAKGVTSSPVLLTPSRAATQLRFDFNVSTPKREDLNITVRSGSGKQPVKGAKGKTPSGSDKATRDLSSLSKEAADHTAALDEELFVRPKWRYRFIRASFASPYPVYAVERVDNEYSLPTTQEVYDFARELFLKAQLGAECIIVSLVYVERLMETAGVVLLVNNWRTILLCALLLASKVWQDLSSWNVEFSIVYPQYTLDAINRLERTFVQQLHFKLYISGSVYAKYYFALRSMSEQGNFRQRYMATIAVGPSVKRIEDASNTLKNQLYSRSL